MMLRSLFILLTVSLTACAIKEPAAGEQKPDQAMQAARIKDQVLSILCDEEIRDVPQELVRVVEYARERDGRSDRVWEVADRADCGELQGSDAA